MTPRTLNTQPCAQVECLNNGTCVLGPDGQASCLCLEGFNGERCEFSACATMPCMNGGVCRISGAEPICECPFGVTGILCEQAICDPLCENGGSCELVNGTAICQCLPGTTGINCNLMDVCAEASTCAVFGEHARCRLDPNSLMLISPVPVNASYLCECANDHNEWVNCLELAMQAGPFTSLPPLIAVKPSTLNISQPTGVNATKIGSSISVLSGLFNRSSVMNKTNEESPFNVSGELPFPHLNTDSPTLLHSITTTEPSGTANELTTTQEQDLTSTDELNRQLLSGFIFPGLTNATGSSKHSSSNDSSEVLSSSESTTDADLSSAPNRTSLLFPPFSSFTIPNFTSLSSEQLLTTTMQPFSPAVNATKLTDMQQNQSELPWSPFEETLLTNTPPTTDLPTEPDYDLPTDETSPSTTEKTDVPLSTEGFGSDTTSNEETATTEASIPSSQLTTMRSIVVSTTNFEQPRISTTTEAEQSSEPPTTSPEDEDEMGNEVVTSEVDHYPYASSSSSTPTPYQPDSNQSHKASAADDSSSTSWIIALVIAIVFLLLLAVIALFVVRYIQRSRKLHGKYNPAREENVLANSFSMPMTTVTKEERLI
ncbi:unnamed protein product [Anisakis simplex]|uniref:Abnormal pharyngeal pumping eat-20 (inferred by orthology to a C. elegans protein) n=1 Tax=Anisakis simplex TaxID=6269 RepID=A0A0M3JZB3_ANISI|nr:unnamed protein product [Anisakis simplex]